RRAYTHHSQITDNASAVTPLFRQSPRTPSLRYTLTAWFITVLGLMPRLSATCWFVEPATSSPRTFGSRWVSPALGHGRADDAARRGLTTPPRDRNSCRPRDRADPVGRNVPLPPRLLPSAGPRTESVSISATELMRAAGSSPHGASAPHVTT